MTQPPTPPKIPNFNPGVGRLVTDRYDFQTHVNGTTYLNANGDVINFRHQANQIDVVPPVTIAGDGYANVQDALEAIASHITPPPVPNATALAVGLIRLAGDLSGVGSSATSPKVGGLQGRPVANASPSSGQSLIWNGSNWLPGTPTIVSSLTGDVTGTNTANIVSAISGAFPVPVEFGLSFTSGSILQLQTDAIMSVGSGASITIASGGTFSAIGANAVVIDTAGGFVLEAANDFVQFGTAHTRTVWNTFTTLLLPTDWDNTSSIPALHVNTTSTNFMYAKLDNLHNGATLNSITISFQVGTSHSSVPQFTPAVGIYLADLKDNSSSELAMYSGGVYYLPNPGSGAAYYNGGNFQQLTMTTNQNNIIDTSKYIYWIIVADENGTNSHSGNNYFGYAINYTDITSAQFP